LIQRLAVPASESCDALHIATAAVNGVIRLEPSDFERRVIIGFSKRTGPTSLIHPSAIIGLMKRGVCIDFMAAFPGPMTAQNLCERPRCCSTLVIYAMAIRRQGSHHRLVGWDPARRELPSALVQRGDNRE